MERIAKTGMHYVSAERGSVRLVPQALKRRVLCSNSFIDARTPELWEEITMDALKMMSADSCKKEVPAFNIGDTIRIDVRITEGSRSRLQAFEGTVIAKKGSGVSETFTVRRISYGVGVERVFPLHSPNVESIKVVRRGKVRRSKLYYLRDRVGKAAKVKQAL